MWLKTKVDKLIKKYNTYNPFEMATSLNIHIVEWDLHEDINGFYQYEKRNKIIYINSKLNDELKKIVCAHELGHAILHTKISTPFMKSNTLFSVNKIEREANRFAAELLIPDSSLIDCCNEQMSIDSIASLHQVPVELVQLKCEKLF